MVTRPILESKRCVWHVQKGYPSSVTQVDLILENLWKFKELVTINLNRLSSLHTPLYCIFLFLQFPISSRIFWEYLIMVEREILPLNCKIHRENSKKNCKDIPTNVRQQRKFWILDPLKHLFHIFFEKDTYWKEKCLISFRKIKPNKLPP